MMEGKEQKKFERERERERCPHTYYICVYVCCIYEES